MNTLSSLSDKDARSLLKAGNLQLRVGPYIYRLQTDLPEVIDGLSGLYADFPIASSDSFTDYCVAMQRGGIASRLRREAHFLFENQHSFAPVPTAQAYAFMEWGMNWCVSMHANEYLKLHAAVVARNGLAIIMPGVPGAGKSTLCAALGLCGWRVLSDEHALVPPGTTELVPLCRPVSLKNESIPLIKSFDSGALFGPTSKDTHKGAVAHMKADLTPDSHCEKTVPAHIMLFPRYSKDEQQHLTPRPRSTSFVLAAYHSFNYSLLAKAGFKAMQTLVDSVECYDLVYNDLDWAIRTVDEIHDTVRAQ